MTGSEPASAPVTSENSHDVSDASTGKVIGQQKEAAPRRRRNAALTKKAILQAATVEFCRNGLGGARVDAIAKRAKANMRLLYHYFGDKEGLFTASLEHVYGQIRAAEQQLHLDDLDPVAAMEALIDFTFDFFMNHEDYIALINNENLQRAKYLRQSKKIAELTLPLVGIIEDILGRGREQQLFREDADPVQLYLSITALSYFHVSNRYSLSVMFDRDVGAPEWLKTRRAHARDVLMTWLTATARQP